MPAIDSYFRSDIGKKRTNNEDSTGAFEPRQNHPLNQSGRLYVIADGMGGHQQGEKASSYAVETLLKVYYEVPKVLPEKRLRDIIKQINQNLITYAEKNLKPGERTGTTLVAAVVHKGKLLVANVGDSRAYLLRNGKIQQITRDHSLVGELVRAGTITEAEARQSKYRNRLSRSIGADPNLEVDIYPSIPLRRGDIILLCTDGLTQYASSHDILDAAHGSARDIVERLIHFANQRGGSDNVTVSVIKYGREFAIPAVPALKTLIGVGAGVLLLTVFSLVGWLGYSTWASYRATPTTTASPAPTTTLTDTPTSTPSETTEPTPTQDSLPLSTDTPEPPALLVLIDCEYTVRPGDFTGKIARVFEATQEQVFRQDGTQNNMGIINPGEILTIKDVPAETCSVNGGVIQTPSQ